jgi:hypothetical protein
VFLDPPPQTPSPVQQQQQQQQQQLQSSPQAGLQRMPSIVETRAEIHRADGRDVMMTGSSSSSSSAPPPPSLTATAELDQLLSGMLMNVQNIPDIRPEHRHHYHQRGDDIDVDSIQVYPFHIHFILQQRPATVTVRLPQWPSSTLPFLPPS